MNVWLTQCPLSIQTIKTIKHDLYESYYMYNVPPLNCACVTPLVLGSPNYSKMHFGGCRIYIPYRERMLNVFCVMTFKKSVCLLTLRTAGGTADFLQRRSKGSMVTICSVSRTTIAFQVRATCWRLSLRTSETASLLQKISERCRVTHRGISSTVVVCPVRTTCQVQRNYISKLSKCSINSECGLLALRLNWIAKMMIDKFHSRV